MQLTNSRDRYGAVPQFLHWLTVVLVIVAWALGVFGEDLPKGATRATGLVIHISVGLLILVALATRVIWRIADPAPAPERNEFGRWLGRWADPAAGVAHYTLYMLLVAVPVLGIIAQFGRGDALPLFGVVEIASPWVRDRAFAHSVREIHEIAAHALVIVAMFHAIAALLHHIVFGDNTLVRMLPGGKR
ncbi:cytochrome b [Bradyrhizobium sp. 2S1]|uniref:cytochrome b n=1 Tax=Bradyrhizobium sp. 2S1 TaxID=1404429 RepID=UPI001409F138|nr:cytochrome b [Bradyrhizobium sp. 2S1]MCK7670340.1 cytochrome b [Bradyrhizobium sp. 2S1]